MGVGENRMHAQEFGHEFPKNSKIINNYLQFYGAPETLNMSEKQIPTELRVCESRSIVDWAVQKCYHTASSSKSNSIEYIQQILNTANPEEKVRLTQLAATLWYEGSLTHSLSSSSPPSKPERPKDMQVLEPRDMKLGKGGTLSSRIAILHSLANIEQWAIDLAWDMIARFGSITFGESNEKLPQDFFTDFVRVAEDESRHYASLAKRINELGSSFGDLPVHNGLWQSADETAHEIKARLAIVHMVHEARGLDVTPSTIQKFERNGDMESAALLQVIYNEEIGHVTAGMRWFKYICELENPSNDPIQIFHRLVREHFHGYLKPPFNEEARSTAGFTPDW
eukprot:gene3285-5976_t